LQPTTKGQAPYVAGLCLLGSINHNSMKLFFTGFFLAFFVLAMQAQHLYLEGFGSFNRTKYSTNDFSNSDDYLGFGGRLAIGADHFQVGGEYRSNLTNPKFDTQGIGFASTTSFDETYYGGFVRAKISRYPAMRFGLVFRAGTGVYETKARMKIGQTELSQNYDPIWGINGGFGFSIPTFKYTMLELGYTFNYLKRPSGVFTIPEHLGNYHAISIGLSLNFVFGKRAQQYQQLRENRRFQNG
jgi:hypothetical protein